MNLRRNPSPLEMDSKYIQDIISKNNDVHPDLNYEIEYVTFVEHLIDGYKMRHFMTAEDAAELVFFIFVLDVAGTWGQKFFEKFGVMPEDAVNDVLEKKTRSHKFVIDCLRVYGATDINIFFSPLTFGEYYFYNEERDRWVKMPDEYGAEGNTRSHLS